MHKLNVKIKNFCSFNNTLKKMKTHATDSGWDKILAKQVSNKRSIPRLYKELLKPNNEKRNNPIKNEQKIKKYLTKEDI